MLASVTSGYPDYIQENPRFQAAQLIFKALAAYLAPNDPI